MNHSRLEGKVGLFVFIGLVLLAGLLIQFSKGISLFHPGYEIRLRARNVGGLKPSAQVLMSGVQVGRVSDIQLAPDGKSVVISLRIRQEFKIFKDARFVIEQSGFLGDQYVGILVTRNEGPTFAPGEEATAEPPLDMQEVARSASELLVHIDAATTNVTAVLTESRRTILSAQALTNLSASVGEFHRIAERSLAVMTHLDALVETNRQVIALTLSNLERFSEQINETASGVRALLDTNAPDVNATVKNLEASSATLKSLLEHVQQGQGLAGKMLENEEIAANVSQVVSNLSITTSNLNRLGLWGILWQHKPPRASEPASVTNPITAPKTPFD